MALGLTYVWREKQAREGVAPTREVESILPAWNRLGGFRELRGGGSEREGAGKEVTVSQLARKEGRTPKHSPWAKLIISHISRPHPDTQMCAQQREMKGSCFQLGFMV